MLESKFNRLLVKIRGFDIPYALPWYQWEEWGKHKKEHYQIRFWIFEEFIPGIIRQFSRINDIKWWFLHRFHPKYRYHIIKTGLKPGYYDSDSRILRACFGELNNFVENCADKIDWRSSSDEHFQAYCTMKELWYWWNCMRGNEWKELDDAFSFEKEGKLILKDNQQLIKLMKIRHFMWY